MPRRALTRDSVSRRLAEVLESIERLNLLTPREASARLKVPLRRLPELGLPEVLVGTYTATQKGKPKTRHFRRYPATQVAAKLMEGQKER